MKSEQELLDLQPVDLKLHHGYLKDDVFCLKVDNHSELARFLCDLGNIQINFGTIYVKRRGSDYEFIASVASYGENLEMNEYIQPERLRKYRLWTVNYLSIFFKWIHEQKLVSSV